MSVAATPLPAAALRSAMGHFATGVTVVTAAGSRSRGSTVNAITSVSLDPPLLLICLRDESRTLATLLETGSFGVNVLHEDQAALARRFAQPEARFEATGHRPGAVTGAPLLEGALATLECAVHDLADGGDHRIVIGRVLAVEHPDDHAPPLIFYRGAFRRLGE